MSRLLLPPRRLALVVALLVVSALLIPNAFASPRGVNALKSARLSTATWTFQGKVFAGNVGDMSHPLSGVTVKLYCSNDLGSVGSQCATTTTASDGSYSLSTSTAYDYYNIVETNPSGYTSVGATSGSGGVIVNADRIRFDAPQSGTFTGNNFWDRAPNTATRTATRPVLTNTPTRTATRPVLTNTPTPSITPTFPAGCPDLLINGNFEAGSLAPWASTGAVSLNWGRNGTTGAHLGGLQASIVELRQTVNIPAGANPVRLELWWLVESNTEQPGDSLNILAFVQTSGGPLMLWLRTYQAVAPLGQWQYDAWDLTPYAGSTVTISIGVLKNAPTQTVFVVDDITLRACPGSTATGTATTTMTPQPGASPTATRQADCRNLLINGDFESGFFTPWQTSAGVGLEFGHSGARGARLGGWPGWAGRIWQSVALPAGVSPIRMWFWWRVDSTVERPFETLTVFVERGGMSDVLVTLGVVAPLNQWRLQSLDLTAYAGQTISVIFEVMNGTIFRLDDIVLDACGLGTPTPPTGMECPELLENGNFETGSLAPWGVSGNAGMAPTGGHNSLYGAGLCGDNNAMGELWQHVAVPAHSSPVRLRFWWWADNGAQPGDVLRVLLQYNGTVHTLLTLPATGAPRQWREESLDLTAYAGRSFALTFQAHTDGAQPTLFALDDISLTACPSGGRRYPLYIPLALRNFRGPEPTATPSLKPATSTPTRTATATPTLSPAGTTTPTATTSPGNTATPTGTLGPSVTLVVNTTSDTDDGTCDATHCSLREAINAANRQGGPVTITFNIPASDSGRDANGVCTIRPTVSSYYLARGLTTIDGYTQPGASPNTAPFGQPINAVLKIILDGSLIPANTCPNGLDIRSPGNVIRGLVIQGFNNGIEIVDNNNRIEGCFIGTDVQGMTAKGNRNMSIWIGGVQDGRGSWNTVIGGSAPQARNLISGNPAGVEISSGGYARVQGNYIGTNASGTGALGQTNGNGVRVHYVSSHNLIGGTGGEEANLIAFNARNGVVIEGDYGAKYNTITRNRVHSNTQKGIALLSGGNNNLAAPVISSASRTQASGTACANCTVEVFSDAADEGATYEGTTTANAGGQWTLNKASGFAGPKLTATATDPSGNTSEFSAPYTLPS